MKPHRCSTLEVAMVAVICPMLYAVTAHTQSCRLAMRSKIVVPRGTRVIRPRSTLRSVFHPSLPRQIFLLYRSEMFTRRNRADALRLEANLLRLLITPRSLFTARGQVCTPGPEFGPKDPVHNPHGLPSCIIIGDSVSIGYTPDVIAQLEASRVCFVQV